MEEQRSFKKSFLAMVLALSLIVSMVPISIFAEEDMEVKTIYVQDLNVSGSDLRSMLNVNTTDKIRLTSNAYPEGITIGVLDKIELSEDDVYFYQRAGMLSKSWINGDWFVVKKYSISSNAITHNFDEALVYDAAKAYALIANNESIPYDSEIIKVQYRQVQSGTSVIGKIVDSIWITIKDDEPLVIDETSSYEFRLKFTSKGSQAGISNPVSVLFNDTRIESKVSAKNGTITYDPNDDLISEQAIIDAIFDADNSTVTDASKYSVFVSRLGSTSPYESVNAEKVARNGLSVKLYFSGDDTHMPAYSEMVHVSFERDSRADTFISLNDPYVLSGATLAAFYESDNKDAFLFDLLFDEALDLGSDDLDSAEIHVEEGRFEYLAYEYTEKSGLFGKDTKQVWRPINSSEFTENIGDHLFFERREDGSLRNNTELVRFNFLGNEKYRVSQSLPATLTIEVIPVSLELRDNAPKIFSIDISEVYGSVFDIAPYLKLVNLETGEEVDLGEEQDYFGNYLNVVSEIKYSVLPQKMTISFSQYDGAYSDCEITVNVLTKKGKASIEVKNEIINYGEVPTRSVIYNNSDINYITLTTGVTGDSEGFISIDFPDSVKYAMRVYTPIGSIDIYDILSTLIGNGLSLSEFVSMIDTAISMVGMFADESVFDLSTLQNIVDVIKTLPLDEAKLKIAIGRPPVDPGLYFVTALSTNRNYEFVHDTGYLVILSNATDDNGIRFRQDINKFGYIEGVNDFVFGGDFYEEGVKNEDVKVDAFYFGRTASGKKFLTRDKAPTEPGKYTEILSTRNVRSKIAIREIVINVENVHIIYSGNATLIDDVYYYPEEDLSSCSDYEAYFVDEGRESRELRFYIVDDYGYKKELYYAYGDLVSGVEYEMLINWTGDHDYQQTNLCDKFMLCDHADYSVKTGTTRPGFRYDDEVGESVECIEEEWLCSRCGYRYYKPQETPQPPVNPPTPPYIPPYSPITPVIPGKDVSGEKKVTLCSEDGSLEAVVTIEGSKAILKSISEEDLAKLVASEECLIALDLSKLGTKIDGLEINKVTLSRLSRVLKNKTDDSSIKIIFSDSSIEIDKLALAAIKNQTDGSACLKIVEADKISTIQKLAIGELNVTKKYSITLLCNGKAISDLNGGKATITVPYSLKSLENPAMVSVWFVGEDGAKEEMPSAYFDDYVSFSIPHFSLYVISYQECGKDNTCPLASFEDLNPDAWYHDGFHFCISNGFFEGVSSTKMSPNACLTKEQLATVFYRIAQREGQGFIGDSMYNLTYNDSEKISDWAYVGTAWLTMKGFFVADENGNFNPKEAVTRSQFIVYMKSFVQFLGYKLEGKLANDINVFIDVELVTEDALPAVQWALDYEIIYGDDKKRLNPDEEVTRAEAAAMLARLYQHN